MHICHWPPLYGPNCKGSPHICHWPKSMTNVHEHCVWFRLSECIFVIDHSQWQICIVTVFDLNPAACIFVIDQIPKRHCLDLSRDTLLCIFVIDHSQWQICMNAECDLDSVTCIFVIDHSQWQMCMDTECDLDSVSAYLSLTIVNDKCAWTLSVI